MIKPALGSEFLTGRFSSPSGRDPSMVMNTSHDTDVDSDVRENVGFPPKRVVFNPIQNDSVAARFDFPHGGVYKLNVKMTIATTKIGAVAYLRILRSNPEIDNSSDSSEIAEDGEISNTEEEEDGTFFPLGVIETEKPVDWTKDITLFEGDIWEISLEGSNNAGAAVSCTIEQK
jgi:hypothetical protein